MAREQNQGKQAQGQQGSAIDSGMGRGETSVLPDKEYNLISVLYHALQGAETYAEYIQDAKQQADDELASFFADVQQEELRLAERAKHLLAQRLSGGRQSG